MKFIEDCTYWMIGERDIYGAPQWKGPFIVRCRWEDKTRIFINNDGRESRSNATVYPESKIPKTAYIVRGISNLNEPPEGAREVKEVQEIPNLRGTKVEYRALL